MNTATERMLGALPEGLKARGWRFVKSASRMSCSSPPTCVAVYVRRYEPGVDDDRWSDPASYGFVRITTDDATSTDWEAARANAVARMIETDDTQTPL